MNPQFPVTYQLKDGTHVLINPFEEQAYSFHLTRLNSEKHNFIWRAETDEIEEAYETRFDQWQLEAVAAFKEMLASGERAV
jgi:hypothetical protein